MAKNKFEKLSKTDENRILNALDDVSGLINDGNDPNEAITKVASQMKLPSGFIDSIVYAYNTGRTNIQRKSSDDVFEKAAEFPLADAEVIRSKLYPSEYKSASTLQKEASVSVEYSMAPVWLERKPKPVPQMVKAAAAPLTDKKPAAYPRDETVTIKRGFADIQRKKKQLAEFQMQKSALFDKCMTGLNDLVSYFKQAGNSSFADVKANASIMFGKDSDIILDMVKQRYPAVEKQATVTCGRAAGKSEALVGQLIDDMTVYNRFSEKLTKAAEAVTKLEDQFLRPFVLSPKGNSVIPYFKEAGILGNLFSSGTDILSGGDKVKNIASELQFTKPTESLLKGDLRKLTDPAHDQALREAQVESMLNDLMANDEIISEHKPEDVLRIYNEINQMAPRAADQKMLVRSLLRKRLQYGGDQVDPFDVQQLLDIDNKIRTRDELPRSPLGTMGEGPVGSISGRGGF